MKPLNDVIAACPPSGIRRFFDIAAEMDDVISLGVGEPDFVTPWRIREAGMLHVNIPTLGGEAQVPFGGTKASGLGAHECGEAAFDFFSEERIVYVAGS